MKKGQSIIEILVAVAVGALLVIAAAGIIAPVLRANTQATRAQAGAALGKELSDNIHVWTDGDWHNILNLATTSANTYYLNTTSSPFSAATGTQSVTVTSSTYSRYFYVDDVQRDASGNIVSSAGSNDPSTKKITVGYNWPFGTTTTFSFYLTRNRDNVIDQTDWSGGGGQNGPATTTNAQFSTSTSNILNTSAGSIQLSLSLNSAGTVGSWSTVSTAALPSPLYAEGGFVSGGFFYMIGGTSDGTNATTTVFYTSSTASGALNTWQTTSPILVALKHVGGIAYNGFMYSIAGEDGSNSGVTTVYYTSSTASGALNTWQTTALMPQYLDSTSPVVNNGFIYAISGLHGSSVLSAVYYTSSTASGALNTWQTGTPLPSAVYTPGFAVAYNGFIYVIGGVPAGSLNATSTVYYTSSTASGALNAWQTTTILPSPLSLMSAVVNSNTGYIYVTGGQDINGNETTTVLYTSSTASGALNSWQTTNALPSGIAVQSTMINGNNIYTIGGTPDGANGTTTVFSATFN